jgi:hypothetical protein
VHPGGEHILAAGAYDASAFYHSMHPGRDCRKSELLTRFAVGEHVGPASWKFDSAFAIDLIRTVRGAMGTTSWYAPLGFWIRTVVICLLTLLFEYRLIYSGSIIYGILVGAMHAQIGLAVQHDGSHGALSKNPAINAFFAYGNRSVTSPSHIRTTHSSRRCVRVCRYCQVRIGSEIPDGSGFRQRARARATCPSVRAPVA